MSGPLVRQPEGATVAAMDTATARRHIACDGAFNLRDLGGYPTETGEVTRWATLYRADGLHRVGPDAAAGLAALGWKTVLDLRTIAEVDAGAFRAEGVQVIHLPVLRETWRTDTCSDADPVSFLVERYLEMLDHGADAIAAAVAILGAPGRLPAVFHCAAGKDRTGVLAALVLAVAGVADETIAADYALSASAMDRIVAWYRSTEPEVVDRMVDQPQQLLACPAVAMVEFLGQLRDRYGSVEDYLTQAGASPTTITLLRSRLVD